MYNFTNSGEVSKLIWWDDIFWLPTPLWIPGLGFPYGSRKVHPDWAINSAPLPGSYVTGGIQSLEKFEWCDSAKICNYKYLKSISK